MHKILFLFPLSALLFFSSCDNSSSMKNAEAQKAAAAAEKEAVMLDSISNVLELERANIEADIQNLEASLKAIEE